MTILVGDCLSHLATIEPATVQAIITSPPYFGLRKYGADGREIGGEQSLDDYVAGLVAVGRECWRVLRDDGVMWMNLGDSYAEGGNALLVPFRVATALQAAGWTLRAMLPWIKLASMPESVQSRPCVAHEYVLFLTKRPSGYFYDADAVRVPHVRLWDESNGGGLGGTDYVKKASKVQGGRGNSHNRPSLPNPAGRSLRSSDFWRAGARDLGEKLLAAAEGNPVGLVTNDDAPAALVVNPKGSGLEHFAMWPVRLVLPMVRASTPEAGSCSVCGAPWERVVEKSKDPSAVPLDQRPVNGRAQPGNAMVKSNRLNGERYSNTLGFRPSCAHVDAPSRPAIVLDPFAGAFTSIGVALALGRDAIGIELYQKNADLAPRRINIVRKEMAEILRSEKDGDAAAKLDAERSGQLDMFGAQR